MRSYVRYYGGYQVGCWAGQLRDGRAISLGEVKNLSEQDRDLQLRGAGWHLIRVWAIDLQFYCSLYVSSGVVRLFII